MTTNTWDIHSMHLGRDWLGAFLFFVDANANQHRLNLNENQLLLLLRQMPDVIISAPVIARD